MIPRPFGSMSLQDPVGLLVRVSLMAPLRPRVAISRKYGSRARSLLETVPWSRVHAYTLTLGISPALKPAQGG